VIAIGEESRTDRGRIAAVHREAFGRDAEARLVDALRAEGLGLVSVVARDEAEIFGHAFFSRIFIDAEKRTLPAVALAPVAVVPARQRSGIGSGLVRYGIDLCRQRGEDVIFVVGDPHYYARFGFSVEPTSGLTSPYSGSHWMALELRGGVLSGNAGIVRYPLAFALV
jgi:putative acetyltransferase